MRIIKFVGAFIYAIGIISLSWLMVGIIAIIAQISTRRSRNSAYI